jgi:Glu-tRNA(Gln) amidotransferase subunit E-like FAD-binding protein
MDLWNVIKYEYEYQTTLHHIPEELHSHCHENKKSHQLKIDDSDIVNDVSSARKFFWSISKFAHPCSI